MLGVFQINQLPVLYWAKLPEHFLLTDIKGIYYWQGEVEATWCIEYTIFAILNPLLQSCTPGHTWLMPCNGIIIALLLFILGVFNISSASSFTIMLWATLKSTMFRVTVFWNHCSFPSALVLLTYFFAWIKGIEPLHCDPKNGLIVALRGKDKQTQ